VIDLGIFGALIGAVALIVIGPEKLPRVARTIGTLLGKAQRYVSDVKAEVNRSMELEELKKMKHGRGGGPEVGTRSDQPGFQKTGRSDEHGSIPDQRQPAFLRVINLPAS
jgi:sec-independent protein translocase protein TatB